MKSNCVPLVSALHRRDHANDNIYHLRTANWHDFDTCDKGIYYELLLIAQMQAFTEVPPV